MRRELKYATAAAAGVLLLLWLFCLPRDLFEGTTYSTVVTDRNGALLGARVADDGQWRFPPRDTLPEKFVKALVEFEDHTFSTIAASARRRWHVPRFRTSATVAS